VKVEYTPREMMAVAAAREIKDGEIVFCGTGLPLVAAMAAKLIYAPNSIIFFETGAIDSQLMEIPLSVADPRVMYRTCVNAGLAEAFGIMQNPFTGPKTVAILGAAQIDIYGNINSTCIGDYWKPQVRFPGSGGGCDAGSFAGRTIIFVKHEKRRFVPRLDYLTTPGYLDGPDGRVRAGYKRGSPRCVITDMALMRFDPETKRMYLDKYYPGITPKQVQNNIGFSIDVSRASQMDPPLERELRILREKVDPQRLILG